MTASVDVRYCVVCDDVRYEVNTKEILVGVYTAGLKAPSLPFAVSVCLWLVVVWDGVGSVNVEIQVVDPFGIQVAYTQGVGQAILPGYDTSLVFRNVNFTASFEGDYSINWRPAGGQWQPIRKFPIMP